MQEAERETMTKAVQTDEVSSEGNGGRPAGGDGGAVLVDRSGGDDERSREEEMLAAAKDGPGYVSLG